MTQLPTNKEKTSLADKDCTVALAIFIIIKLQFINIYEYVVVFIHKVISLNVIMALYGKELYINLQNLLSNGNEFYENICK